MSACYFSFPAQTYKKMHSFLYTKVLLMHLSGTYCILSLPGSSKELSLRLWITKALNMFVFVIATLSAVQATAWGIFSFISMSEGLWRTVQKAGPPVGLPSMLREGNQSCHHWLCKVPGSEGVLLAIWFCLFIFKFLWREKMNWWERNARTKVKTRGHEERKCFGH